MLENKIQSTSKADLLKKEKFFQEFPEEREHYKDWPFWDDNGYPMPDPAEVNAIIAKGIVVDNLGSKE